MKDWRLHIETINLLHATQELNNRLLRVNLRASHVILQKKELRGTSVECPVSALAKNEANLSVKPLSSGYKRNNFSRRVLHHAFRSEECRNLVK